MVTKVDPVDLGEIVTAGDDYNLTITLTKDGAVYDVTDATITASIRAVGGNHDDADRWNHQPDSDRHRDLVT